MRHFRVRGRGFLRLACCLLSLSAVVGSASGSSRRVDVLKVMEGELNRSMTELSNTGEAAPYFISYRIVEHKRMDIQASYGALVFSTGDTASSLNVNLRVGGYEFDSSHQLRDELFGSMPMPLQVSLDDPDALTNVLWRETDRRYKEAVERYIKVQSDKAVKTAEENPSDDFSKETPLVLKHEPTPIKVNRAEWEGRLKRYSAIVKRYPFVLNSSVSLSVRAMTRYFASSEGSRTEDSQNYVRLAINLETRADDGMELRQYERFDAHQPSGLPDDRTVEGRIRELADALEKMKTAPVVEPFAGPAILSGRAAGVFFHEIFGHRIEGFRQKIEAQDQTFAKKTNERVLPDFLSVVDDPTIARAGDVDLNGHYEVDDEGVAAQSVVLVENGVLKGFLMSRSPFKSFNRSNGHGRAEDWRDPVSRQGNLIIRSSRTVPSQKLRDMLIEECTKQGKPYGLIFADVEGGFTMTGRRLPNAFNVSPILVYRVYADGRPDEIVRGVDLIGTPLTPFGKILATDDAPAVFNGICGAESGDVPVSAVCPSLLVSEIEVQKKQKTTAKPPILPPPGQSNE